MILKLLCKIGLHSWEHKFTPFADQPFADDDLCCIEGTHSFVCTRCGDED